VILPVDTAITQLQRRLTSRIIEINPSAMLIGNKLNSKCDLCHPKDYGSKMESTGSLPKDIRLIISIVL
jgi:hypothetical protein